MLNGRGGGFVLSVQGEFAVDIAEEDFERRVMLERVWGFLELGGFEEELARKFVDRGEMERGAEKVQEGACSVDEVTSVVVDVVESEVALADTAELVDVAAAGDADRGVFAADAELAAARDDLADRKRNFLEGEVFPR